jgi:hypothetical protein
MSMDQGTLRALAEEGFGAVPPNEFEHLARDCWDWCEATGDGRYCSLAHTLAAVSSWWSEYEAVPRSLSEDIERVFLAWLGDIMACEDRAAGANLARLFRQEVLSMLLPPQRWTTQPTVPNLTSPPLSE